MANTRKYKDSKKKKPNLLPILTLVVVVLAVAIVIFVPKGNSNDTALNEANNEEQRTESEDNSKVDSNVVSGVAATLNEKGDVVINEADITEKAIFLEYKSKAGMTVGLLAVRASDGTVRTALDTCQVCNGSPYAYFTQVTSGVQCQNCGNIFKLDMIEQERGGCNPIPIMPEDKTVKDSEIIIPADFLEENADIFENWKKF